MLGTAIACEAGAIRRNDFTKIKIRTQWGAKMWLRFESSNLHVERAMRCTVHRGEAKERKTVEPLGFISIWDCGVRTRVNDNRPNTYWLHRFIAICQCHRLNIPLIKLFFSPFCRFLPSFACTTSLQTRIRIYICLWSDALNALHREQTCFSPHRPAICKPFFFCRRVVRRMRCALAECSLVLFG